MGYILRTIYNADDPDKFFDNYHQCESYRKMIKRIKEIDPDSFQCFEVLDITNEVMDKLEKEVEQEEMKRKLELYEELKKEFENG